MSSEVAAPSGTLTLVFSDIQGSTVLWEYFDSDFKAILDLHNALIRESILEFHGYEVKTEGDAFMVAFQDAIEAVKFCMDVQLKLQAAEWPAVLLETPELKPLSGVSEDGSFRGLRVRIGAHSGEPEPQPDPTTGRTDYFGPMVNRAARVSNAGHGGQVLISESTWRLVEDRFGDVVVTGLGEHILKGLERQEVIRQVMPKSLEARSFPRLRTQRPNRTNLPARLDSFVGRESELRELRKMLDDGARLLNILGAGGTGKTRIAQQFGHQQLSEFTGGVWFCDLTQARTVNGICTAMANALDVSLTQQDVVVQLTQELRSRGPILCILDNYEQVVDYAAVTVGMWLKSAPEISLIVTSRERLKIEGERVYYLDPLPIEEAVQLFEERAKLVKPAFSVTEQNRDFVVQIVDRLDRMSLAIELAAARVRILSPEQLLKRLAQRFSLLRRGGKSGEGGARQQTLEGAIRWSWELLEPWEQMALAQCSVFRGGFTLDAAEEVLQLEAWDDAPWTLDVLEALQDKSLLQVREVLPGHERFFMYESIRVFATDRLSEPGAICAPDGVSQSDERALQEAGKRFATYYARFGTEEYLESLALHGGGERLRQLALDIDNLLTSLHRSLAVSNGDMAARCFFAATNVLTLRGPCLLASELAGLVLSCPSLNPKNIAQIHFEKGRALRLVGRADTGRASLEEARQAAEESNNRRLLGSVLGELAIICELEGLMDDALAHYEQALEIHRELHNQLQEGIVLANMGIVHRIQGRDEESKRHYEAALKIHQRIGNRRAEGIALCNLANLLSQEGKREEAMKSFRDSLVIFRETGNRRDETLVLGNLGDLYLQGGELPEAREHLEAAVCVSRELGLKRAEGAFLGSLGDVYARMGESGEAKTRMDDGETLLRDVEDKIELGKLLCRRGHFELSRENLDEARRRSDEANELALLVSAGSESILGKAIAKLSKALSDL